MWEKQDRLCGAIFMTIEIGNRGSGEWMSGTDSTRKELEGIVGISRFSLHYMKSFQAHLGAEIGYKQAFLEYRISNDSFQWSQEAGHMFAWQRRSGAIE